MGTYQLALLLNLAFPLSIDYGFITAEETTEGSGERNKNLA